MSKDLKMLSSQQYVQKLRMLRRLNILREAWLFQGTSRLPQSLARAASSSTGANTSRDEQTGDAKIKYETRRASSDAAASAIASPSEKV